MRSLHFIGLLSVITLSIACGDDAAPADTGTDAATDAARDSAPGDAAPGDATPGDATPGDAAPGDAAPSDAAPSDATPGDTCATWTAQVEGTYAAIRSCTDASECGQDIPLGCGCTRNPVARLDADVEGFRALLAARPNAADGGACPDPDVPSGSTCDCPAADGYLCTEGVCEWNLL